jgi:vacuolar-type H+-ATPase subunit H
MSGETERNVSGWTIDTLHAYMLALREADSELQRERDRRYTEIAQEREKALKIKETADRDALGLAREIQTYKDEKANELREQISSERGLYATKDDVAAAVGKLEAVIKPLIESNATHQGDRSGRLSQQQMFMVVLPGLVIALITIIGTVVGVAYFVRR